VVQGHQLAQGRGSLVAAPFEWGWEMDAKALDLALLASLSVLCAIFAWQSDRDVVGSLFFALGAVAMIGAGYSQQRR
jgi:hypothetical protein